MKFILIFLLLIPLGLVAQNEDAVTIHFVGDTDSFPDCNTLYYANGDYLIKNQEIIEIDLPNTLPIEPSKVTWNGSMSFRSFALEAAKCGSMELDDCQITSLTNGEVLGLIKSTKDSSYGQWLIRDEEYLWSKFGIFVHTKYTDEYKVGDSIYKEEPVLSSGEIIDGIVFVEREFYKIEKQDNSHLPESFDQQGELVRKQAIQPKLDSILHPFYFSNYEVTNREYREFIKWVADSIELHMAYFNLNDRDASLLLNCSNKERKGLNSTMKVENLKRFGLNPQKRKKVDESAWVNATKQLYYPQPLRFYKRREKDPRLFIYKQGVNKRVAIYPDTTGFDKLITGARYVPMSLGNMSWHPAFEDYPIVNVNEEQIMAFCHWKERQLNEEFSSDGYQITVRPPTITEYEFAAKTSLGPQGYFVANDQSNENFIPFTRNQGGSDFLFYQRVNYSPFVGRGSSDGRSSLNYREWYRSNQSFSPIKFLNGNVSELVIDQVTPEIWKHYQLNSDQPKTNANFILGSNYIHDVKTRGDDQYNAIFYKTTLENGTSSPVVGFRLVYIVERTE